jgi:signal transduction histidine kinase
MRTEPHLNRFQRWYFTWAERHYLRMQPQMQAQARALDRLLYSRRGLWVWLGLIGSIGGATAGLRAAGMPLLMALILSSMGILALAFVLLVAWLQPEKVMGQRGLGRLMLRISIGTLLGVLTGWVAGRLSRHGLAGLSSLSTELEALLRIGVPVGLSVGLVMALLVGLTAAGRRYQLQQELQEARAAEERAQIAREASEARLRLLQAQIQPHFIFNTLSAVQHWVDSGDARASGLLRALTAFLRGSAELMMQPQVRLAEELALVGHYLSVMQARWGERLRYDLDIDAATAERAQLPPGIVLSLLENALEHGLAPTLSGGSLRVSLQPLGAEGWILRVQDDGVGLDGDWQAGLGVSNSRARLEAVFGTRARLRLSAADEGGTCAELVVEGQGAGDER